MFTSYLARSMSRTAVVKAPFRGNYLDRAADMFLVRRALAALPVSGMGGREPPGDTSRLVSADESLRNKAC